MPCGAKVTVIPQEFPAATLASQVLVSENLSGFVPAIVMLVMLSVVPPVLVRVVAIVRVLLNFTRPKFRLAGTSSTVPTVMVIVALANLVASATEVAVIVTVALAGTVAGAV
jgi:hypothetical protein